MISADGKELMDNLILSKIENPKSMQMMMICKKYGLSVMDATAMLLELSLLANSDDSTITEE